MSTGRIVAAVGPVSVAVVGASTAAVSIATVIVATGGAVAIGLVGYGIYRWYSGDHPPEQLPGSRPLDQLPESGSSDTSDA